MSGVQCCGLWPSILIFFESHKYKDPGSLNQGVCRVAYCKCNAMSAMIQGRPEYLLLLFTTCCAMMDAMMDFCGEKKVMEMETRYKEAI